MEQAELRKQQKKIIRNALVASVFCSVVLAGGYILLPKFIDFPTDLSSRIAFAIQADIFVFLWVVIGIRMVSRVRFYSVEDNRGSAYTIPSAKIAVPRAFLQNTLEQAFVAVGAHLALATLLSGSALSVIPASVLLFGIGRIAFLRGYPYGAGARAFGIVTTVLPTMFGYIAALLLVVASVL